MLGYYFKLGVRSLRRNPVLTALMILTLAIGVAASISTLTILYVMSGDPIPHKSDRLVVPVFDNASLRGYTKGVPPPFPLMSYKDAAALLRDGYGMRRTPLYDVGGAVEPARPDLPVVKVSGAAVNADYFPMFEIPFLRGRGWSAAEDQAQARVLVLSRKTAEKLYGKDDPVGKRVRLFNTELEVVGVLDAWAPLPRYTHLINGSGGGTYDGEDQFFMPFSTAIALSLESNGSTSCFEESGPGFQGKLASECIWIQFWYELKSGADVPALRSHLDAYLDEQRKLGRFPRPEPARVYDVKQWMELLQVVGSDSRIAVWLAFGFLLLCLFNTMGLLLAKFSVRSAEVGVRRALGATRGAIFRQLLVETAVIGVTGGALGLLLALGCLRLIAQQSAELSVVARMDWAMLGLTLVLAVGSSVLAGLLPTWRACQITPAVQLKSQ